MCEDTLDVSMLLTFFLLVQVEKQTEKAGKEKHNSEEQEEKWNDKEKKKSMEDGRQLCRIDNMTS